MIWRVTLSLWLAGLTACRPLQETDSEERVCRLGNLSLPLKIFEAYIGWECYEATFAAVKSLPVRICMERFGSFDYSVPCFKSGQRLLSFNLNNEETVSEMAKRFESEDFNDQMIRCFLRVVTECETSSDGWLMSGDWPKSWIPEVTAGAALSTRSKFHVGMLSISMIVGMPVATIFVYSSWVGQNPILAHCKNLITTLVLRTLFTILIETEVVAKSAELVESGSMSNWPGCEALVAFEAISLNLVLAFWLILTFHVLEYAKNGFEKQPNSFLGSCIIGGLALTFAIVWTTIMAVGGYPNCWLDRTSLRWVNDSLRLGFLILQVFLISVVIFRFQTDLKDLKADEARLTRRLSLYILVLSPLFLLQFSLSAGQPLDGRNEDAYFYIEYFFDGLQCAAVSIFFIFLGDIRHFILDSLGIGKRKQCHRVFETMGGKEMYLDALSPPKFAASTKETEQQKDVPYSSVLTPERFEKTIRLYNRLQIIPSQGSCGKDGAKQRNASISSVRSDRHDLANVSGKANHDEITNPVIDTERSDTRKLPRNNLYRSKYLINDSEPSDSESHSTECGKSKCDNCGVEKREKNLTFQWWKKSQRNSAGTQEEDSSGERTKNNDRRTAGEAGHCDAHGIFDIASTANSNRADSAACATDMPC